MKVLVTGGSGFIGSALLRELANTKGVELIALEHRKKLELPHSDVTIINGSLRKITPTLLKYTEPDVIFHLARPTYPRLGALGRKLASLDGQFLNRRLMRMLGNTRLVYVSGSLMYGNSDPGFPHTEDQPLQPISFARDYYQTEIPILRTMQSTQRNILMVRVPWVLGPGSWFHWVYRHHFQQTGMLPLFGEGRNLMHFVLQEDLAKWLVETGLNRKLTGIRNGLSSTVLTQRDFVEKMQAQLQCNIDPGTGRYERAIQEAFRSNIELDTLYKDCPLEESDFDSELQRLLGCFLKHE